MHLFVDPAAQSRPPWPQPYFRGLSHFAYAGLDQENSLLVDLRRRRVVGRFSRSMAADKGYWQRVIFPTIVGFVSDALGVTVVHCGCVQRDGSGLLLAGESGSGKSTLSVEMARNGFAFVSDDWTYLSGAGSHLLAWGLPTPVKLLPGADEYFHELRRLKPRVSLNGERAYEVDPERVFGVRRSLRCKPCWLVFLERQRKPGHSLVRIKPEEAAARLEYGLAPLPPELAQFPQVQKATIRSLSERECWLLRYGQNPQRIAQVLAGFCMDSPRAEVRPTSLCESTMHFVRTGPDLIRRFTPTPLAGELRAAGRAIRLETNSPRILLQISRTLDRYGRSERIEEPFLWRVVADRDAGLKLPWPNSSGFSADGLSVMNIGQRSFLAVDRAAHCAVGFVAEELLDDEIGFEQSFLERLFSITFGTPLEE